MKNYFNTKLVIYCKEKPSLVSSWLDMKDFNKFGELVKALETQGFHISQIERCRVLKFKSDAPVLDKEKCYRQDLKKAFDDILAFDEVMDECCYSNKEGYTHFAKLFYAIEEALGHDKLIDAVKNEDIDKYEFHPKKTLKDVAMEEIEEIKCCLGDYPLTIYEHVCSCIDINEYISKFLSHYAETKYGVIRIDQ